MKRKRSQLLAVSAPSKRRTNVTGEEGTKGPCHLVQLLRQYGLLISITSHLTPSDLFALAATSMATYQTIFPRKESRANILSKMSCDGTGISIRNRRHRKSRYFAEFNCTESVVCGTADHSIQSRPCVRCGHTTCDECRIHCLYQSIYEAPDEPDELPNYSGFALLDDKEMGILTPAHLNSGDISSWDFPCYDQGFLDLPLEASISADMVDVTQLINTDLGPRSLSFAYSSGTPHPSPVIRAFWEVAERRKREFCGTCFAHEQDQRDTSSIVCHCTLKSHLLDRWLCIQCYDKEQEAFEDFPRGVPGTCSCGTAINDLTSRILCLWCGGQTGMS